MSRLVAFMARRRTTWVLWMTLGTPLFALSLVGDVLLVVARQSRKWGHCFTDAHRREQLQ